MTEREPLSPFSYVLLALVGRGGAGPHDIVQMMRRGRLYWAASESHYYAEAKRLERLGYLRARKEPGRTRPRTHYELTPLGREALVDWGPEPTPLPRIQSEAVVKLLAGDLIGDEAILRSLQGLRRELDEESRRLDQAEQVAAGLLHRERYLRLVHTLGRSLVAAHREWLDLVERELGGERR